MKLIGVRVRRSGVAQMGPAALLLGILAVAPAATPAIWADDATGSTARAVRLSSVDGRVQISQGGQTIADPALANTPLFEGTQVVTNDDGKAEVQFEDGSVARLSPNSSLTLTILRADDGAGSTEIRMDGGLGYFELQAGAQRGHIQVRFGDALVTSSGFTVLRVDMDNAPGDLAVFSGNAHLERGNGVSLDLHGGENIALNGQDPSKYDLGETIEPDSWDTWNADRDQVLTSEAASRTEATQSFANSSNPAWNDLDANGNWYNVPDQGYVWSPYDASTQGWDPYGNGYWMYNPGVGYGWISGDSWGYLPFSCGRWNYYNNFGWGWNPGAGACSPWWSGGGWISNIGFGPIGYLPPRLPHRPPNRNPIRPGNRNIPYPVIAVNKRPPSGFGGSFGSVPHGRGISATIAGHVVMPARTVAPRTVYDRTVSGPVYRTSAPGATGVRAPGAGFNGIPEQSLSGSRAPAPHPIPSGGQHVAPPPGHVSLGGGAPASRPAPSGGGGGGAPHGGGGGGGAPHH